MPVVARLFCLLILLLLGLTPASAEKRVALVIGNGAYQKVGRLANPPNDAAAIAAMLKAANFDEVKSHQDLGIRQMRQAISDFARLARNADTAVVYYSGHGMEIDGTNYLIPIDAVLDTDEDVPYEAYSLDNLLKGLEPVSRLRLVMLDACRDNPFLKSMKRTTRAIGRGLAVVEPTRLNTLIAYAAKAGSYALDGEGTTNSPYATALMNHLATPGLDLRLAFGSVRDDVLAATNNKQEPWLYGSLGGGTLSLVSAPAGPAAGAAPIAPTPSFDPASQAWAAAKDTTNPAILEAFIRRYGDTFYGDMARARLEELKKSQIAVVSPPRSSITELNAPDSEFNGCRLVPSNAADNIAICTRAIESGRVTGEALADAYFHRALSFQSRKNYSQSMRDFDQAVQLMIDIAQYVWFRGCLREQMGDKRNAKADFDRGIQLGYASDLGCQISGLYPKAALPK